MSRKSFKKFRKRLLRSLVFIAFAGLFIRLNQRPAIPTTESHRLQVEPTEQGSDTDIIFSLQHPQNFDEAKRRLRRLFAKGQDAYCGCSYDLSQKHSVQAQSCGLKIHGQRGLRIEWEHVVPASHFGRKFTAWSAGDPQCEKRTKVLRGRNCAREASRDFRRMEADLYNLLPAVGELNQARSDFAYGEVPGEPRRFGACDFEVKNSKVEPPDVIRGDVARIFFYMNTRYPGFHLVHSGNQKLLERWATEDPLDETERERLKRIEAVQGNSFFIGPLQPKTQGVMADSKPSQDNL